MMKKYITAGVLAGGMLLVLAYGAQALTTGSELSFRSTFYGSQMTRVFDGQVWFNGDTFKSHQFKQPAMKEASFHSLIYDAVKQEYYISTDGEKEYVLYQNTSIQQALAFEFLPGHWLDVAMLQESAPHRLRHYLTKKGFALDTSTGKDTTIKNPYEVWRKTDPQNVQGDLTVWVHPDEGIPVKATVQTASGRIVFGFEVTQHKTKQTFAKDAFKYPGKMLDKTDKVLFTDNLPQ